MLFAIANTSAATNNGYGLNYWGGFLGVPNDHGVTLAITGLNIADLTTGYTLVNTTFGTLATTRPSSPSRARAAAPSPST